MHKKNNIKSIVIIDKHKLIKESLKQIIETDKNLKVIGFGDSKKDAINLAEKHMPDLLIINVGLMRLESFERIKDISYYSPTTKIMLLSDHGYRNDYVIKALYHGVRGFLVNSMQSELFIEAIFSVVQGDYWLHPIVSNSLVKEQLDLRKKYQEMERNQNQGFHKPLHIFTLRECDVLQLLVEGKSNLQIAAKLGITEFTVKTHVRNIFGKMNVNDRTNAVLSAIKNGWVKVDKAN